MFMPIKVSTFVATSLDGFIARKDGGIDWLSPSHVTIPQEEDCGFVDFMNSVDAVVMGRNTFEQVLTFDKWVYGEAPLRVASSRSVKIPPHLQRTVSSSQKQPSELLARFLREGKKHIYVDGGLTIRSFLREDLLDELTITIVPIVLGEGKPLFAAIGKDVLLEHVATKTFDFGYVQLKYRVHK